MAKYPKPTQIYKIDSMILVKKKILFISLKFD